MIKNLNREQKLWLVKALSLYDKLTSDADRHISTFAVILDEQSYRRIEQILKFGNYDDDRFSYDMRCINALKSFYRYHRNYNTYNSDLDNYIMGVDIAKDGSNDFATFNVVKKTKSGILRYY